MLIISYVSDFQIFLKFKGLSNGFFQAKIDLHL
jgi:hypothetical protein